MATRQAVTKEESQTKRVARPLISDEIRLEQWFVQFDAKLADLSARQDALMRSLGVEPVRSAPISESV
jgi:hypothetical protein